MKASICIAIIALGLATAIDLKSMTKSEVATDIEDGPTNGTMTEEEKDTLIQVLCPGNVQTSFTQTSGKSSTCNSGAKPVATAAVQESEETGETQIEWNSWSHTRKKESQSIDIYLRISLITNFLGQFF